MSVLHFRLNGKSVTMESPASPVNRRQELLRVLRKYWGYGEFLPLQEQAMQCVLAGHDSVVVLPTGGGKSVCFQAPAMCRDGLAIVVSPLISLMKDQVDALRNCGVPAASIHSMVSHSEKQRIVSDIHAGRLRLLYVVPERLLRERTLDFLKQHQRNCRTSGRADSTVHDYLTEYIRHDKITDPTRWVDPDTARRITESARRVGVQRLRPIFDDLAGEIDYDRIRIVVECLRNER